VVIVVNYQSGDRLRHCLRSVLAQPHPAEAVVVVDNASSDGSTDGLPPGVRLVRRATNAGFAAALLDGLALTTEPFVFTLNPDTLLLPGCLEASRAALRSDLLAGSIAPRVLQQHRPGHIDADGIGLTSMLGQLNWHHDLTEAEAGEQPHQVLGPLGGAALWRRVALERAGNFDPRYFLYWEDVDIALRLDRAGYVCRTAPTARVLHEGGGTIGHHSARNVFYMARNHWPCLLRSLPGRLLRDRALWVLLAPLRAAALYARRGQGLAALAGLVCGLVLAPRALLDRRRLPRSGSGAKAAERIRALMREADAARQRMKRSPPPSGQPQP